jgi:putative DNA primase/helicase
MITAVNGWLLAFDNLSSLPNWLSDSLCRLASGSGFATRALYSNEERNVIYAQRPIILSGIDEFVRKGDLADRAVFLHLPAIINSKRREEDEFWGTFRELRPKILGGLLDAVSGALRELPSVRPAELPRMADFARFGEAVGRGLGWPAETFLAAYLENRKLATLSTLEDSILANVLLKQVERCFGLIEWCMPASEMLATLTLSLDRRIARSPSWPKTPAKFGNELRRLAPMLAENGLFVMSKRTEKARLIILTTRPQRHLPEATIETNIPGG